MAKVKSKKSATANQEPAVKRIRSQAITKANIAVAKLQKDAKAAANTLRIARKKAKAAKKISQATKSRVKKKAAIRAQTTSRKAAAKAAALNARIRIAKAKARAVESAAIVKARKAAEVVKTEADLKKAAAEFIARWKKKRAKAEAAKVAILPYFRGSDLTLENKDAAGFDPVTAADKAAEQAMRDVLATKRPQDGIWGEEFGRSPGESGALN